MKTKKRHPVPLRRRKRQVTFLLILAFALVVILFYAALCEVSGRTNDEYEAAHATPAPTPTPKPWTKYPVPLSDSLQKYIQDVCEQKDISPAIVMAVIGTESEYTANAVGDNGNSVGLMQIQEKWHSGRMKKLGCYNLMDPYQNVKVRIDFLAELTDMYDGDIEKALSYYSGNGGEPCEYSLKVVRLAERLLEGAMTQQ